jgi:uncharacterized membrane protein YkoI
MLAFAPILFALPAHGDGLDYERAREALERNEVLPLARILPEVEQHTGARMIEVEFELEDDRYVYEFELVTADGRLIEAIVDASTGQIVSVGPEDED